MDEKIKKSRDNFMSKNLYEYSKKIESMEVVDKMTDLQFQSDSIMVMELFVNWLKTAKTKKQKDLLNTCIYAKLRIDSYTMNIQTIIKALSVKYNELLHHSRLINSKNIELKKENEILKKQVEYYEGQS